MINVNKKIIVLMIIMFIFAFVQGGNLPYYIFYTFVLILTLSLIYILIQKSALDVEIKSEKDTYNSSETANLLIVVKSIGFTPWVVMENEGISKLDGSYKGEVAQISPVENRWLRRNVVFQRRGIYNFGNFTLSVEDLFGVFKYAKKVNKKFDINVYPHVYDIKNFLSGENDVFKQLNNKFGTGEDIFSSKDVRKYTAGDNLKRIHWKVSAKYGELYVKNYDIISGDECSIFLNMSETNMLEDESGIEEERLVDFCVSVINYMLSNRINNRLFISAKDPVLFEIENQESFDRLMDFFLNQMSNGNKDFTNFINDSLSKLHNCTWIGIVTMRIDDNMLNNIPKIKNDKCKIVIFYSKQQNNQIEIEATLNKIGVECINIS